MYYNVNIMAEFPDHGQDILNRLTNAVKAELQVTSYTREVFGLQQNRRFTLGFTLCSTECGNSIGLASLAQSWSVRSC
ncbi:hypothetical protein BC938DRAFT_477564 [Jimgerdemannia flammicorona]|uniref:Fungal-type protein kinase domain-containing protein n=1 Tax=Jimgerdemannia flammicorona TaxID=994334 RepID=A0A433P923_9FUNG|nr:hypothetical protein BC938DRAFT_477564 [Jimgerdemannia flammicorona]